MTNSMNRVVGMLLRATLAALLALAPAGAFAQDGQFEVADAGRARHS